MVIAGRCDRAFMSALNTRLNLQQKNKKHDFFLKPKYVFSMNFESFVNSFV